ncbi:MAG: quinone oxidoreductase [Chitinophagales bacterium]|nr:quinone oxidoreductase [Hyphomicrobiales bacterium]
MTNAMRVHAYGGPEVLQWETVSVDAPGPGEAKIRHHAVGLNYIDVYHRTGFYPQPSLPFTPGTEGAGEVLTVGDGVSDLAPGDRVAYAGPIGAYAEERIIASDRLVKLRDNIDYKTGAAMMLQGMTVEYLLNRTYKVGPDTTMLFHAAAGGVGLIACQWAKHLGATIIGTVSSEEKAALARANGCTHTINYTQEDFVARVKEITGGAGVDVVYDSIGKDTFPKSLECLKPLGLWVSFGNASGAVPPMDVGMLSKKGSLFVTRPTLATYTAKREDLVASAGAVMDMIEAGVVKISINQTYPLREAATAHRDLEARKTTGSTIFTV